MNRRGVVVLMVTGVVATLGIATPQAHATAEAHAVTVPALGNWSGTLSWSEKFAGASASTPDNYCGTTVTETTGIDWSENVDLSGFTFTVSTFNLVSKPAKVSGSVSFTVTTHVPETTFDGTTCPALLDASSGSFSGTGNTTVSGEAESGGPYLQLHDSPAGSVTFPQSGGWPGSITQTDTSIDNGKPFTTDGLLWFPRVALDIEIAKNDTGSWVGVMPGTNFFQKNNGASDIITDDSYNPYYTATPAFFGLHGSAAATVAGPPTTPPATKITHGPKAKVTATKATFHFTSSQPGSTFECALDKAKAKPCTSPKTYTHLAKGKHTLHVDAVDQSGLKDATPAHWSWTIVKKHK
jgi:hypothetical protein